MLNSVGEVFVLFAVRMLVQSSVLILILLFLVKLILPPSLSSPTSLVTWIGGRLPEKTTIAFLPAAPVVVHDGTEAAPAQYAMNSPAGEILQSTAPVRPIVSPTWQGFVMLAWAAAVIIMLLLLIQRLFRVIALTAQSQEAPGDLSALLEQCRRQMAVSGVTRIRLTCLSASPSVCGLLRPVILAPEHMTRQLGAQQLKSVLFHELAHIKRGDLRVNLFQTLLQIVYLYHPLLWLANAQIRRIREQAVDETVLAAMGEDAEDYPRTLLSISKLAFGQPALSLRLLGVVESKRALTARIRHIVSRPFPSSARLGLAGLTLVLAVGAVLLPMAKATHRTQTVVESETEHPIRGARLQGSSASGRLDEYTDANGVFERREYSRLMLASAHILPSIASASSKGTS